jgi:hypothetical protein
MGELYRSSFGRGLLLLLAALPQPSLATNAEKLSGRCCAYYIFGWKFKTFTFLIFKDREIYMYICFSQ